MTDSTDRAATGEEPRSLHECSCCFQPGADVCVRITPSSSGAGHAVHAHRQCATDRGIDVLYALTQPTGRAS